MHAVLDGRTTVSADDVRRVAAGALRHRIILNFEGEAEGIDIDKMVAKLLDNVPSPSEAAAA